MGLFFFYMHTSEQKPSTSFLKNITTLPPHSWGAKSGWSQVWVACWLFKSGWDGNVFSTLQGREHSRQLSVPQAGRPDRHSLEHNTTPKLAPDPLLQPLQWRKWNRKLRISQFSDLKAQPQVSVTKGMKIKRWLSFPLNNAHRTRVRLAKELKSSWPKVWHLCQGKPTKLSLTQTYQYSSVLIYTNNSLGSRGLRPQSFLLI